MAVLLALGLAACGATPALETGTIPPRHVLTPEEQKVGYPIEVSDPWEGWNRGVYKFNALFDEFVFLPVVDAYEFVTPVFVQERVSNFFSNLSELRNGSNGLMQLRPEVAGRAAIRFAVNSTVGVLGLFLGALDHWSGRSLLTVAVAHASFNVAGEFVDDSADWIRYVVALALGLGVLATGVARDGRAPSTQS